MNIIKKFKGTKITTDPNPEETNVHWYHPEAPTVLEGTSLNVDSLIDTLLKGKQKSDRFFYVDLDEDDIFNLCHHTREIFLSQPMLLELSPPLHIVGDIHGQYQDLLRWFELAGYPPDINYLFLGDYVDRGNQSIEVICLLMAFKVKYPVNFFMLRGNHECATINVVYGFYEECLRRYSKELFLAFRDTFNCLPVAALIDDKILCCHGGISPSLNSFNQIRQIQRPIDVPQQGIICDLLWADPDPYITGYQNSERGVSFSFGREAFRSFIAKLKLDLLCRAHQVVEDGYELLFNRTVVTIFSAPNYCGEFDNAGGMMIINEDLICTFLILQPIRKKRK